MADYSELKRKAQEIRDEVKAGANTANRVGLALEETVKALEAENERAEQAEQDLQDAIQLLQDDTEDLQSIRDRIERLGSEKADKSALEATDKEVSKKQDKLEFYKEDHSNGTVEIFAQERVSMSIDNHENVAEVSTYYEDSENGIVPVARIESTYESGDSAYIEARGHEVNIVGDFVNINGVELMEELSAITNELANKQDALKNYVEEPRGKTTIKYPNGKVRVEVGNATVALLADDDKVSITADANGARMRYTKTAEDGSVEHRDEISIGRHSDSSATHIILTSKSATEEDGVKSTQVSTMSVIPEKISMTTDGNTVDDVVGTIIEHGALLNTLNGEGEGSVSKTVTDKIAEVVAGAPTDLDTLKEIADYIASDKTNAAEINNTLATLTEASIIDLGVTTDNNVNARMAADAQPSAERKTRVYKWRFSDGGSGFGVSVARKTGWGYFQYRMNRAVVEFRDVDSNGSPGNWHAWGGTHVVYDTASHKIGLASTDGFNVGSMHNFSTAGEIPTATETNDGLMTAEQVTTLEGKQNKLLTYQEYGKDQGGITAVNDDMMATVGAVVGEDGGVIMGVADVTREEIKSLIYIKEEKISMSSPSGEIDDVVKEIIGKAPKVGYAPDLKVNFAKELVGRGDATPEVIGSIRPTGVRSIGDGNATIERIKGESVVWNQIALNRIVHSAYTYENGQITITDAEWTNFNVNKFKIASIINSHKYLIIKKSDAPLQIYNYYASGVILSSTQTYRFASFTHNWIFTLGYVNAEPGTYNAKIYIYDLTQMFGANNEPTTIEEFEARKPLGVTNEYNEGTIISYDGDALKSVGFNAYNGTYAKVIGGEEYHATGTTSLSFAKELDGDTTPITLDSNGKFTPTEDGYVYAEGTDIVIHLTHSYTPDHVDEYEEDVHPLPDVKSILDADGNQLFPHGLLSAGGVHDEITATKAIKRVGVVDMGILGWSWFESQNCFQATLYASTVGVKPATNNILLPKYNRIANNSMVANSNDGVYCLNNTIVLFVRDTSYTTATDFKQAMSGVLLYYELAEPIEVDLPEPLNMTYEAWDFGTEELIYGDATTPLNAEIVYQFNAVDRIRENSSAIDDLEERVEEHKDDGIELLDNGNLKLTLKGETREFMPATPSGDPMHYAYVSAGAEYNDSGVDIVKDAPWADYVDTEEEKKVTHKAGYWYLNGLGDLTTEEMRGIYAESQFNSYPSESIFINKRTRTLIDKSTAYPGISKRSYQYYNNTNIVAIRFNYANVETLRGTFTNCSKLKYIYPNLNVQWVSSFSDTFDDCNSLVSVSLSNVKQNISFASSQFISKASVKYMIENATPTSTITITLHHDAYERLKEDADILQTLETKNAELANTSDGNGKVSLVCATDNDTIPSA